MLQQVQWLPAKQVCFNLTYRPILLPMFTKDWLPKCELFDNLRFGHLFRCDNLQVQQMSYNLIMEV